MHSLRVQSLVQQWEVGTLALTNSWNDSLIQKLKKENLKTDEQKKDEKKEEIK